MTDQEHSANMSDACHVKRWSYSDDEILSEQVIDVLAQVSKSGRSKKEPIKGRCGRKCVY